MKTEQYPAQEESLDPSRWTELEDLGSEMVHDMMQFLKTIRSQPVWQRPGDDTRRHFDKPLPREAQSFREVYEEFKTHILPYHLGNMHPRFWSWVMGNGSAQGMLAEMLAAGMNSNVGIGDQAAMYVDRQVVAWCKEMMNFPGESSGSLVSGASGANLNALIVARNAANRYIRQCGLQVYSGRLVMYASTETHSCIQKAAEIMGIGSEGLRKVNVNSAYEMDTHHLEELIKEDLVLGNMPFCVVANVGTVNTGAIDPLQEIFFIALKYRLWFHIDGAFGALLKLLPEYASKLTCLELADSIAFDLHKWMYMPYEAGVVLVKDAQEHRNTYALQPDYIANQERGIAAGPELPSNFGFDLSRGFKALKVWMTLKEQGIDKFGRLIRQNIQQANYLAGLIRKTDRLEVMAPVSMNIVCFRYNPGWLNASSLDDMNREILLQLQEQGIAAPSYTRLKDAYCLRVAVSNHRSRREDFDQLIKEVQRIGKRLTENAYSRASLA